MKTTIATATLLLFLSSFCFSETVTSHINEKGQMVFTNTGPSPTQQAKRSQEKTEAVIDEIIAKHPEMDATRADRMVQIADHYINLGNPTHVALLRAERRMIEDGELIDHETVAAEKLAAEKRRQREAIEREKQLLAIQTEESKREKRKLRRRQVAAAEEEETQLGMVAAEEASRENRKRRKREMEEAEESRRTEANSSAVINNSSGWDTQGRHHTSAGGGNLWRSDGTFMQKAAGGYIDTKTGRHIPAQ